jgi:hypothetical protein
MTVIVDLPAVRPGRLAARLGAEAATEPVRALRAYLRGAVVDDIPEGIRLTVQLGALEIAELAAEVRMLANQWPFLSFLLLADPPDCALEVTGRGVAAGVARAVFAELGG